MDWNLYTNFLVAIIAIINPITIFSIWSQLTYDVSYKVRLRIASLTMGFALITLSAFLIFGKYILNFFGIDLMVFKVAGGILLLTTGIKMVEGNNIQLKDKEDGDGSALHLAKIRFKKIIVPMAIPMLVGPGSITTMFLYGVGVSEWLNLGVLTAVLAFYLTILTILLSQSSWVEHKVDSVVFSAVTRLLGIIITAIALQFILEGLGEVFPEWLNRESPVSDSSGNAPANGN
ncbi:MAG: MarC family protein [Prolixibacteraceae bacterium]